MNKKHTEKEIQTCLSKESIGILGTLDSQLDGIRLRVMYYGFDERFNFYLMSTKNSPKVEQIISSPHISFMVYGVEDPYDQTWEVEINGTAKLLTNVKEIESGLLRLKGSNPFADVAIESGISGQFDLIRLMPKIIRFRIYEEALKGEPPTVIQF